MASIEHYGIPSRLYRYRSLVDRAGNDILDRELKAIEEGFIWTSRYDGMNDPMEGIYTPSAMLEKDANYATIADLILRSKESLGIASFSETYNHELMWAHYAGQFSGICISYSLPYLCQDLPDGNEFVPMQYSEAVPRISKKPGGTIRMAKEILTYKNHRWLYEREWRLFAPREGKVQYKGLRSVRRVYIGARVPAPQRAEILRRMRAIKVTVLTMSINEYSMTFRGRRIKPPTV